ncbi:MAG: hypothetical protein R3C28_07730 [Pirellulaceae bacterium]
MATVNQDGVTSTWNVDARQALESRQGLSQPTSLRFIDATDLLVTNQSQQQKIHTSASWELVTTIGSADGDSPFADRILAIDFHPSEPILAVGGARLLELAKSI